MEMAGEGDWLAAVVDLSDGQVATRSGTASIGVLLHDGRCGSGVRCRSLSAMPEEEVRARVQEDGLVGQQVVLGEVADEVWTEGAGVAREGKERWESLSRLGGSVQITTPKSCPERKGCLILGKNIGTRE